MQILEDDVIRLAMTGGMVQSSVWQLVWHYVGGNGANIDSSDAMAAAVTNFEAAFNTLEPALHPSVTAATLEMWIREKTAHRWDGIEFDVLTGLAGLAGGDPEPHGVAALVRFPTSLNRRQARKFLPGLSDIYIDSGVLDATALAEVADFADIFPDQLTPAGGDLDFCTYNTDPASGFYETFSVWNGVYIINALPGYQRRRKPLVGL